jgi:heavy metal efflux system protein
MKITGAHKKYQYPLLALAALLLVIGAFSYNNIKTGLFPDIAFPKIKVIADAGQMPVDKMMTTVTVPLENSLKRTEGLDYIRSTTSRGSCEISVFLKWSADVDKARQQIEALISNARNGMFPGINFQIQKMNPSALPVMGYSLEGNRSQVELKQIAQYQVKPYLAAVPGIADVAVIGGKTKEYQIILKPEKISALGISFAMIRNAVQQSNILESNGYISDHNRLYLTLTDNALDNLDELKNLILLNSSNRLIRLSDVADVEINQAKEYVKINANAKDVPLLVIFKQPDANLIEVNEGVATRANELRKILPKDVSLVPFYKQADFVYDSIKSIQDVLWIGLALTILVVIVFLGSLYTSLVVLLTIPITLALTLSIMFAFGYTFNIMTLGAIAAAIGLMIDDAVIVVEQIHRNHEELPDEPMHGVVSKAINYLFPSMIGSSLSTIVIFIPFSFMSGVAGAFFKVLACTMVITLSVSFVVTWLILPALYLLIPVTKKKSMPAKHATRWIYFFLERPVIGLLFITGCILVLAFIPPHLPSGFLPDMDEGTIVLDFKSPPGTTLEETDRMLCQVDAILMHQPEVEKFSRRLGTELGFFITEPNRGDFLIQLKKNRNRPTEEVSDDIRKKIESTVPQLTIEFGQIIADMLGDLISSVEPVEIKVFGDNRNKIEELSRQIAEEISHVEGTADVYDGITIAGPEVSIQPDVPKLAQLGLTPSDLQFQLQTQIEGSVISKMINKEQQVDIRLIYPNALKTSIYSLENTSIFLPNGMLKPLRTVAKIQLGQGVAEVNRENQKMMGVITARLNNRDLGSTLKDIQKLLENKISLPPGYHIEYGGSYAQQQQAFKELLMILITASLLVFLVILFLFHKIKIAISIVFISILGAAGCLLALFITGTPLNVGSYTGIIMIVGIIGENAIFTYNQFREAHKTMDRDQSIVFSIATRLRPKLMTASGAIIALLPLAMGIGAGAQLHQPLAIAVIGGLIVALPLLLLVLPSMIRIMKMD